MKTSKRGRKIGRPPRYQRQRDGSLVDRKDYHDLRTGRKMRKQQHLDADPGADRSRLHKEQSDPGGEGVNVVDG